VGVDFLERTAVRATLAWLRLAQGTWIESDLGETLRRPSRSMHPRVADWVTETRNLDDLVRLSARLREPRDSQRVEEYAADIAALESALTRGRTTGEVLDVLFHEIGLAGSIVTLDANRHGMNRGAQHDDLTALAQLATLHTDAASFPSWLSDQLRGTLVARRDRASGGDEADGHQQGVTLATVHRVKGQEWPVVVIHEVTASQFPHRLADDLEEERRLFHVAMTRAASQVTVVAGEEPSPFIDELTIPAPTAPTTPPGPSKVRQRYEAERQGTGPPGRTGTRRSPAERASVPGPAAEALRTSLKELRLQLAAGKPAYTVFDDATLEALIAARPSDVAQLRRIPGIGPKRLEAYGGAILEVLAGQEG
jgi:DNA helicase-2/ATP-dependent DNA helicase PcrA